MKILVIGNGFIGASIINRLENEGHELLIFAKSKKDGIQSKHIIGSIFDESEFSKALLWGPEVIIHSAWITTHGIYEGDPSNYDYSQFTADLAKSVAGTDVSHLIILGTCGEYGLRSEASTAGITNLNPINTYAQQKAQAFISARNSLHETNTRLSWVRVFQPYGPNQDKNRLLPYLIENLRNEKQIYLRDTSSVLDWISIRDIASAISWILDHDTPDELDAGTTIGYTNVELLQHLEVKLGLTSNWVQTEVQSAPSRIVSVVGKESPLFLSGWRPDDDLDSGLKWVLGL